FYLSTVRLLISQFYTLCSLSRFFTFLLLLFFSLLPPSPTPTLFPCTTLFRSCTLSHTPCFSDICCNQSHNDIWDIQNQELFDFSDRKSTRLNSSHVSISYAVFCLKKKKKNIY